MRYLILILLIIPFAYAQDCERLDLRINESTILCRDVYNIDNTIEITADNITLDCDGSELRGSSPISGILLSGRQDVSITNCIITGFANGIYLEDSTQNTIANNNITGNNNGIVSIDSAANRFYSNDMDNARNTFEVTSPEEEITEEEPEEELEITIFLEENNTERFNEIRQQFSGYADEYVKVERELLYNPEDNTTSVTLTITPERKADNYSYYEKIPKCMAQYAKDIIFRDTNYKVIADDPIIMWSFVDLEQQKEISYKVKDKLSEDCRKLLEGFGIGHFPEDEPDYSVITAIGVTLAVVLIILYIKRN